MAKNEEYKTQADEYKNEAQKMREYKTKIEGYKVVDLIDDVTENIGNAITNFIDNGGFKLGNGSFDQGKFDEIKKQLETKKSYYTNFISALDSYIKELDEKEKYYRDLYDSSGDGN